MSQSWTCPYCNRDTTITNSNITRGNWNFNDNNREGRTLILVGSAITCPNKQCREYTIEFSLIKMEAGGAWGDELDHWKLRPRSSSKPFPEYIPRQILEDYEEACLIRDFSPKASATLSRRCLQGMIRDFWKISDKTLFLEIKSLEAHIDPVTWSAIDAVRSVGNIGAHMEKDIDLIVDVEPEEAQLLIDLIEMLLKDWYVGRFEKQERMKNIVALAKQKTEQRKPEA
ncbi:DUF4145 domain-containing protein [Luteimonas sp. SMYT11W]|uniref:DUF4145 domain-containing protein n=1 Tax=Luteimonas flava TaxID=3115822 RepID=A0ABU7WD27_9GAMM